MSGTTLPGGGGNQRQTSNVVFPSNFLNEFQNRFGSGVSMNDLAALLPQTQGLFGGGVGYGPTGGGAGGYGGGQGGSQIGGAPSGGGTISLDEIGRLAQGYFPSDRPRLASDATQQVLTYAQQHGIDPSQGFTPDQLRALQGAGTGANHSGGDPFLTALPGLVSNQQAPQFGPQGGMDLSALQIPQNTQRLFGADASHTYQPFQFQNVPGVNAAQPGAEQMNIAPGGFDTYQNALFHGAYDPQARELQRTGTIADQQLQAELAQSGLSSSGSGLGQLQQRRQDQEQQRQSLASDAAYRASEQRFGTEYAQQQFNAQQRQDAAFKNAGLDLDAQKTNASNILAGNIAGSDNYLKTMGLNEDSAHAMRTDFLQLLGVTQKELERLDASQMDKLGVLLNNWLQQGALLGNLGQESQGQGSQAKSGVHVAV